jgi:hypothetical protein
VPDFSPALFQHIIESAQADPSSPLAQSVQVRPEQAAPSHGKPSMILPMLLAALGDGADMATTQMALSRGGVEKNPLVPQNRIGNAAVLGAEAGLLQYLIHHFGPNHPKLAMALGAGTAGLGAYAAAHNLESFRAMK